MSDNPVTVAEAISIRVGNYIAEKKYNLAPSNTIGSAMYSLSHSDGLGLLEGSKPQEKSFAYFFRHPIRRPFIAVLWFNNRERSATHKKWLLEVSGRAYLTGMQELAEDLAAKFEVEIHIRLISETAEIERFSGDNSV